MDCKRTLVVSPGWGGKNGEAHTDMRQTSTEGGIPERLSHGADAQRKQRKRERERRTSSCNGIADATLKAIYLYALDHAVAIEINVPIIDIRMQLCNRGSNDPSAQFSTGQREFAERPAAVEVNDFDALLTEGHQHVRLLSVGSLALVRNRCRFRAALK